MRHDSFISKKCFFLSADLDRLFQAAAHQWMELARQYIRSKKIFVVALSGGKSPIPFFKVLSKHVPKQLWQKTHIFLVDERCVSAKNDEDSNIFTIHKYLISKITIPRKNIHAITASVSGPAQKARHYDKHIKYFFKLKKSEIPRFDLMVLGLGEDGHVASLFPGTDLSGIKNRIVTATSSLRFKYKRVTLNMPVINCSRNIFFIIYGKDKSVIFKKVFHDKLSYPASFVNCPGGRIRYFLDQKVISKVPIASVAPIHKV